MKWLLLISFAYGDLDPVRIPFETQVECEAAGEAFVELNPIFEWLDRPRKPLEPLYLVERPSVGCDRADLAMNPED